MADKPVVIDGTTLTLEQVLKVARRKAPVELDEAALERVQASRRVVEGLVKRGAVVYGVTTGVGELARKTISPAEAAKLQRNLILSTAAGTGPSLAEDEVRAMMVLRLNALAKGVSGVRPIVLQQLEAMLNANLLPDVPCQGSVGASGDLAPLAHLALAMMGEGEVGVKGKLQPAAQALAKAGLKPLELQAKEGLSLINGTQAMTALGILAVHDGYRLLQDAQVAAAMSLEALLGTDKAFDARLHEARPHDGQKTVARNLRLLLEGSAIIASHRQHHDGPDPVQDPYTLRCIPQVLGAAMDQLRHAEEVLAIEVNSATDNPLVLGEDVVSGGNFHGQPIALALASVAPALATIASFSERRVARLVDSKLSNGLPAFLTPSPGLNGGLMIPQYTAAALVNENKALAFPLPVDSIPTSANQEDFNSMGMGMALHLRSLLTNARAVVAIEVLCAAQALEFRKPLEPAPATKAAYDAVRARVPALKEDRYLKPDLDAVRAAVEKGEVLRAVQAKVGELW
ncbi:MAG TPA: histidine ammonia-lyase [Candidatus Thermoplasmatota archaeon]|nr:histidine ammonia-lyase [Candidatus Thermoplasmatota archaeon]